MADREFLQHLTRKLIDDGKLVEAGWLALRLHVISLDASPTQLSDMRLAFMAGAQHVFASMIDMLDPASGEPSDSDMRRLTLIDQELSAIGEELKARNRS